MNLRDDEHLSLIVESAPIGVAILDAGTLFIELINDKFLEIAGKPKGDLLGKWYWEPFAEARELYETALSDVARTGAPFYADEIRLMLIRYGSEEWIYVTFVYAALQDNAGKISKVAVWVLENTEKIKERELISASEKRLRALVTTTTDVVYSLSADWEIMYPLDGRGFLQDTHEPITGWRKQNVYPDDMDLVDATIAEAIREKKIFELEHRVLRADGSQGWTISKAVPILDEKGEITEWFGTASDITLRKEAERSMEVTNQEQAATNEELIANIEELALVNQQLGEARQKIEVGEIALRLAIDAANFGTWFIHSATREFITDARLKELFGYYPDEQLSIEQAIAQIREDYRDFVSAKLENAIYNHGDYDVSYPVIGLHDNRLRWLRAIGNLKADPSGTFSAFTGVVMDITEQTLASEKLQNAYEQLRLSREAAELGFFDLDLTKNTLEWDARCRELFGVSHNEPITYENDFVNGLHPDDRDRILAVIAQVFDNSATNGVYDVEYRTIGAEDKKFRWVRAKGQAYFDNEDRPVRFIGSVLDITEQKADELRKNDFIGMVSHELKTPLTSLTGIIQVADKKLKNSEDRFLAGAMEKANVQVKRMSNMINGFLNVSRLESAKLSIDKSAFDVEQLIEEVVSETKLTLISHVIRFERCREMPVFADRDKIGSVITNLITNAIKYSPKGTTVEVRSDIVKERVQISVKDEGMGLKPQDRDKVFERYFRAENHINVSGFGIGLYLSAEIVQRHNGHIWVESELNKGSTFAFTLPL
ncbi:MAG: PAS domain-containing protein [Mucilaginibacter sp.]|nr:PAS domain-containing protein [Mucilaginibacter sp.]